MKEKFKNVKGITLVALIITIIVLLILAVVSINSIRSNNILQHAKDAKEDYSKAEEKEKITLAVHEAVLDGKGAINKNGVQSGMNSQFKSDGWEEVSSNTDSITVKIKASGNQYKITLSSGKVEDMQGQTTGGEGDDPAAADKYIAANDKIEKLDIKSMYTARFSNLINNTKDLKIDESSIYESGYGIQIENTEKAEKWLIQIGEYDGVDENKHHVLYIGYENENLPTGAVVYEISSDSFTQKTSKEDDALTFESNVWKVTRNAEKSEEFNWTINGTVTMVAPEKSNTDVVSNTANNQLAIFINNITHPDSN